MNFNLLDTFVGTIYTSIGTNLLTTPLHLMKKEAVSHRYTTITAICSAMLWCFVWDNSDKKDAIKHAHLTNIASCLLIPASLMYFEIVSKQQAIAISMINLIVGSILI